MKMNEFGRGWSGGGGVHPPMVYLSVKPSDLLATAAWLADPFLSTIHQAAGLPAVSKNVFLFQPR